MKKTKVIVLLAGGLLMTSCSFFSEVSSTGTKTTGTTTVATATDTATTVASNQAGADAIQANEKSTNFTYSDLWSSQGVYSLPSKGTQNMLILPITVKGYEANATDKVRSDIQKTLFGSASETGWQSLSSYYATSSHGNVSITGTVADWYACGLTKKQIADANNSSMSEVTTIINAAVANYKQVNNTDCKEFDNNGDGYLDGIMVIYSCPNDYNYDKNRTFWAFTFETYNNAPSTSSPVSFKYFWAAYDFMYEGYGASAVDAHTFIHETGHMFGLDDYYDYDDKHEPMGEIDMMDYNIIDQNAFSKFSLGWITPYVVTGSAGSLDVTLNPAATANSHNAILFPTEDGWNGSAFDEYIMMEFYTPTGLNKSDAASAYGTRPQAMTENGVRIYHVDARMAKIDSSGTVGDYTDNVISTSTMGTTQAHSNTASSSKNEEYCLIQALDHAGVNHAAGSSYVNNNSLWQSGDSFSFSSYRSQFPSSTRMNDGTTFGYVVSFSKMSSSGITLTITHN
jgi:M6 family metalloprotease-like protein